MKNFKIISVVLLVSLFFIGSANAESKKNTSHGFFSVEELDCVGAVTGQLEYWVTDFGNGKIQQRFKGVLHGVDDNYIVSQVLNCNLSRFDIGLSNNGTQTLTLSIISETTGMVVGEYHHTWHVTLNAKDELVVVFQRGWIECY
nr:hypothetical protein [uncultured Draconibacterium sp.]